MRIKKQKLLGLKLQPKIAWILLAAAFPAPGFAQSFSEATAKAVSSSQNVRAARLRAEAISEQKVQALNLRRPNVQLEANASENINGQWLGIYGLNEMSWRKNYPKSITLSASQPLFLGGRVQAALREGELRYAQSIARVRALELVAVRNTIEAYANLLRDYATLVIRVEGVANFQEQLRGALVMQTNGLIGLTDVSQVQTRLAAAQGQEAYARARFMGDWASFTRLIGETPTGLTEDSLNITLPESQEEAVSLAIKNSHEIKIARFNEDIARASARVTETEQSPRISINTSTSTYFDSQATGSRIIDNQISARLIIPIWSGGQNQSRIRAALGEVNAARLDALDLEQQLTEQVAIIWENIIAARANVTAAEAQVAASEIALKGAVLEQRIGTRTTLEVLNQQQEVLEAKVNLASARRELLVSSASLMLSIGIDPTGTITDETQFDPWRSRRNVFQEKVGIPMNWEAPLVTLHDALIPLDNVLRRRAKVIQEPSNN